MADNFSAALAAWKDINLSELQKTLDAQGVELVENQKESVVGRKGLADKTREFRRLPDEEKLTEYKSLLKAYQTEIDSLTQRAKSAETAFLNAYKILAEAPDPYPILEGAVDQIINAPISAQAELELSQLRDENSQLRTRIKGLESVEKEKRKAEEKLTTLEQNVDKRIEEKTKAKEAEVQALFEERILNFEEREKDLTRQLELVQTQLKDLRISNESSQQRLLDQSQRQDNATLSRLAEMDILLSDLDRANSRVATVERRNEALRAELENLKGGSAKDEQVQTLESRIQDLETELSSLLRTLESQKNAAQSDTVRLQRRIDELTRELGVRTAEVERLGGKLKAVADYDEIKRELEIMKYVEFSNLDPSEDDDEDERGVRLPEPNAKKANEREAKSLEGLLAMKNRKLLEELTRFRVLHSELEQSFRTTSEELATSRAELEKQKMLTERLENDLMHVDRHMGKSHGETNGVPERSATSTPSQSQDGLAGLNIGSNSGSNVRYTPIPFSSSADTSILPIVTSQRDRFRQRNAELEEELKKQYSTIEELRSDIKSLQADNLKLYEKIRYMQSYRDEGPVAGTSAMGGGAYTRASQTSGTGPSRADGLGKYRTLYEQSVNPFEAFRGREAVRAVQALNPLERGVLTLTQAILGNRRTRMFFIVYAMSLHALVLFTSYECTSVGSGTPGTVVRGPR